jgi:hypothetical protein
MRFALKVLAVAGVFVLLVLGALLAMPSAAADVGPYQMIVLHKQTAVYTTTGDVVVIPPGSVIMVCIDVNGQFIAYHVGTGVIDVRNPCSDVFRDGFER